MSIRKNKTNAAPDLGARAFGLGLAALLLAQAWIKLDLAARQPFSWEQIRDWLAALQVAQSGAFPAYGPAMANGPALPGGWYYFLLSLPLRLDPEPLALSAFVTVLYSLAAAFFGWRLSRAYNRAAALVVVALLSFHPVVIHMTSIFHNPNLAFSFLMAALAALLSPQVGFGFAALAGFASMVALQCHAMAVVVFTLPLAWVLARAAKDKAWSLSWGGYACGAFLGGLGYLPYFQAQWAAHFSNIVQAGQFRHATHRDLGDLVFKPLFFMLAQPAYEVSSYFGAGWRGMVRFFRFQDAADLWAFAATYASVLFFVGLGAWAWRPAFRRGLGAWDRLGRPWNLGLYKLATLSLPFWFLLAGRFDAKYTGLFFAWCYLPLAAWIAAGWPGWGPAARLGLGFTVLLACLTGLSLHQRIYAQRGSDLGFARYDYATVDAAAGLLGRLQPPTVAVVFADGNGPTWTGKAIEGLAKQRYGWTGAPLVPAPVSALEEKIYCNPGDWVVADGQGLRGAAAVWIGSAPLSLEAQQAGGWRLWRQVDGMYLFENF